MISIFWPTREALFMTMHHLGLASVKKSANFSEIFRKSFQINHYSLNKKIVELNSLILHFGLKSSRLDVRHPSKQQYLSHSQGFQNLNLQR